MAANKRKILETARKLAQKGAKDKALKEYEKLLKLDPKDAKLRLEIGDAHRRWGQVEEAIETYTRVANQYMAEGFDARAVAVYKQIVNLDPDCLDAYGPLAELYERMGLAAEAISALQTAADGYHRQGRKSEALGLLRRMANADPTNTTSRIKVADLLRQEDMVQDAVLEYALVAEELERQGDVENVGNVYRRILECDEKNVEALSALARNLARRGKVAESIPLAERALSLDAGTTERYEALAGLYERAGRESERAATYRKLAVLHRERGDEDTARNILQRYVPSETLAGCVESAAASAPPPADELFAGEPGGFFESEFHASEGESDPPLDFGNEERLDTPRIDPGASLDRDRLEAAALAADELSLDDPVEGDAITLDEPVQPSAAGPAASLPESLDVEQLLAEASVYLRYGKRDRALAHLERVLASEPEHRPALEKLGEVFAEAGESERAVEAWLHAAKRASDEDDEAALAVLEERIGALDPVAAAHVVSARRARAEAEPPPEAPAPASEIELDLGGLDDELQLDPDEEMLDDEMLDEELSIPELPAASQDELQAEDAPPSHGEASAGASSSLSASATQQVQDDLEEADFYMEQGLLDEAGAIYQRVLAIAPNHPRALLRLGEVTAARGGAVDGALSIEVPSDDESLEVAADPSELSDLDLEGAREPGEPEEPEATTEPEGSDTEELHAAAADAEEGGDFDLAAALAEAFEDDEAGTQDGSADPDGFDAVFDAFKKGVSETLGASDHQAHYDLAIAYKEMGLHDDAIAELEIAMTDPGREAECLHLIALCALDADRAPAAVEHLERLLGLPGLAAEAAVAGRFELGRALLGVGDRDGARRAWSEVARAHPGFQDVETRLAQLEAPEPGDSGRDDDADAGFESFEDVLEAVRDDEPEPAPSPPVDAPEPDVPPRGRKRKKISFL